MKKSELPNTVEVVVGGVRFRMQLWWELSPLHMTVSSPEQKRNPSSYRDNEGVSRSGERVKSAEYEAAGGDVGDKHPVSSSQTQRRSSGQSMGQLSDRFSDRFSGKSLGQIPGRMSSQHVDQDAGKRDGWAVQPNFLPGRVTGKLFRQKGGLGIHKQNNLGFNSGPTPITTDTKAIFQKKRGPPVNPAQALSFPFNAEAEGGMNPDVEKHGEEAAETNHSQLLVES